MLLLALASGRRDFYYPWYFLQVRVTLDSFPVAVYCILYMGVTLRMLKIWYTLTILVSFCDFYYSWFGELDKNEHNTLKLSTTQVKLVKTKILKYKPNFRNLDDPLCSSTITPKFKTIIDEDIYFTEVFHALIIVKKYNSTNTFQGCLRKTIKFISSNSFYLVISASIIICIGNTILTIK